MLLPADQPTVLDDHEQDGPSHANPENNEAKQVPSGQVGEVDHGEIVAVCPKSAKVSKYQSVKSSKFRVAASRDAHCMRA